MEFFDLLLYFSIYAFFGWVLEVLYHLLKQGEFVNRGMLNGPYCPIYALGAMGLVLFLRDSMDNFFLMFISSVFFGTVLELVGGFLIEKIFHMRFWDYSDQPFNIGGYICPIFSIAWGIVGVIFAGNIYPLIEKLVGFLPDVIVIVLSLIGGAALLIDTIITVSSMLKLKGVVEALSKEKKILREISDTLGEDITDNAIKIGESISEGRREFKNLRKNMEVSREKRQREYEERLEDFRTHVKEAAENYKGKLKAFPRLKSKQKELREILEELRESLKD